MTSLSPERRCNSSTSVPSGQVVRALVVPYSTVSGTPWQSYCTRRRDVAAIHGGSIRADDKKVIVPAEPRTVRLDLSAGSQNYVEDCQVCCQPIQLSVQVYEDGSLDRVAAERMDR